MLRCLSKRLQYFVQVAKVQSFAKIVLHSGKRLEKIVLIARRWVLSFKVVIARRNTKESSKLLKSSARCQDAIVNYP